MVFKVRVLFAGKVVLSAKLIPELAPPNVIPAVVVVNKVIALPIAVPLNVLHNRFPLKVLVVVKVFVPE